FHQPTPPSPLSTPFPYTTLFRSRSLGGPPPLSGVRVLDPEGRVGLLDGTLRTVRGVQPVAERRRARQPRPAQLRPAPPHRRGRRSEEHTSELQSRSDLVCRLLLE